MNLEDLLKAVKEAGADDGKLKSALEGVLSVATTAEQAKKEAEEKALREAGKIEELYKIKLDDADKRAAQIVAAKQTEIDRLAQSVGNAKKAQSLAAVAQLQEKIGFHPAASADILTGLQGLQVDDNFNVQIEGGLEKAINDLRESKPYLFLQSQGVKMPQGKASASGVENPFNPETFSLTKQAELFKQNPEQARALAKVFNIDI